MAGSGALNGGRLDGRPESLRRQVDGCLNRLRVERIALLQLHRVDPEVPLADQVGALADLVAEGKAAAIGLSEVSVVELDQARPPQPSASPRISRPASGERGGGRKSGASRRGGR